MASVQCCKPAEQTCTQGQQRHSLGQKVSHLVAAAFKGEDSNENHHEHHTMVTSQTQCSYYKETQTQAHGGLLTECVDQSNAQSHAAICHGKNNRRSGERKKKGLLQKIKDGISGHSDDSSSSSSESDNDNDSEKCQNKKN